MGGRTRTWKSSTGMIGSSGGEDGGRHGERGEAVAGDRVAVEVGLQRAEVGVALDQHAGHLPQVAAQVGGIEQVGIGKSALLEQQRAAPFAQEVVFVEPRRRLDRVQHAARVDGRTDGQRVAQVDAGAGCAQGDAQGEVAA